MYEREQERIAQHRAPVGSMWADFDRPRRDADEDLAFRPCSPEEAEARRLRRAEDAARAEVVRAAEASCPAPRDVAEVGHVTFTVCPDGDFAVWVGAEEVPELVGYTDQPASDEAVQAVYDRFLEECE
jgi:hypothetical protein